jgi:nucleoside-triphosphatase THEP1
MNSRVSIVSGGIDKGKTQRMEAIYLQLKQGDGFLSKKMFTASRVFTGYEIVRMSTGEKMPLAYTTEYVPTGFDEIDRIGPFRFSGKALAFAGKIIDEAIDAHIEPVFIDEIGPLELNGKGFCTLLSKALAAGNELYIAVRSQCTADVISKFGIINPRILESNPHDGLAAISTITTSVTSL